MSTTRKTSTGSKTKSVTAGKRVGFKKRDMRWEDPNGDIWASRFEYEVYVTLKGKGYEVRRTVTGEDSILYAAPCKGAVCGECQSKQVAVPRRYTPDLFVRPQGYQRPVSPHTPDRAGYYIETKGYLRADKRSLLRALRQARPDVDMRLIVQRDYKVGKGTLVSWAKKYLKIPVTVWNGDIPQEWK